MRIGKKKKLTPTSMEQCSWQAHELLRWRWRWRWRWSCPCQRHEGISVSRGMERIRGTQWIGCGFSPRAGLDVWKKITCPLLGFERWAFQFVASRCTDLTLFRYHFYFMNVKFPGVECVCVCVCVCPLRVTLSNCRSFMHPRGASHDNSTGPY